MTPQPPTTPHEGAQALTQGQVNDQGRYVDHALLRDVEAFLTRAQARDLPGQLDAVAWHGVAQFLYFEARLLDTRRYSAWFDLLAHDFIYWIPSRPNQASPLTQVAVNFDDRRRMLDRIAYTESGAQIAQTPPSRTARTLHNIQAWHGDDDTVEVTALAVIWAYRRSAQQVFVGHQHLRLGRTTDGFRIRTKVIELLDCDAPQGNNSFIL